MMKLFFVFAIMLLFSCGKSADKHAELLLNKIKSEYNGGKYEEALRDIDSLRQKYPKAIAARKEALKIHQDSELKLSQKEIAALDTALIRLNSEYEKLKNAAEVHKLKGCATREELAQVLKTRMLRDSLQVRFDVLVAKIKYINKRKKETI